MNKFRNVVVVAVVHGVVVVAVESVVVFVILHNGVDMARYL